MEKLDIAVLMTCHNRKAKTLACLEALSKQSFQDDNPQANSIVVYLVDDGSTDGTEEAVQANYPQIKVLQGTGQLFWNGGMRLAFAEAIKSDYDYYLCLNDDTILYPDALTNLLKASRQLIAQGNDCSVVVASVQDPQSGILSYGGLVRANRLHPLKFKVVEPGESIKPCSTFNGNCILIPRSVMQKVGNLDPNFIHSTGDLDYGLRVGQQGGSVWLAPGFLGSCEYNPLRHQAWDKSGLTLWERWQKINQPLGLPLREWKVFARRHAGALWGIYWLLPYIRLLWTALFNPLRPQQKKPF